LTSFDSRLLTPPREEEEIYPYRRVWRSIILEAGGVFAAAAGLFVLVNFIGLPVPDLFRRPLNILLALLPALLWFLFSYLPERAVLQPRVRLLPVFIAACLATNAITYPFITETVRPELWLSLASAVNRIFGYTFTVGILQAGLTYIILRYMVWAGFLRTRYDALAYGSAVAIGSATIFSLHFAMTDIPLPDVVAARTLSHYVIYMASTAVLAYGIAESRIGDAPALLLPAVLALSAFVIGAAIPVHAGLLNGSFFTALNTLSAEITRIIAAPRPLFGLVFSAALLISVLYVVSFLIDYSERKQREVQSAREV
jgi:hypothetical protein